MSKVWEPRQFLVSVPARGKNFPTLVQLKSRKN